MKNADFMSSAARLADSMKQLEIAWMATKEEWSDSVSQRVEDNYLVPMHSQIQVMLDTVGKLSGVMSKAERSCLHTREEGPIL